MSLILGLDPGLETTGYGLIQMKADGPAVVEAGVFRSAKVGRGSHDMAERLLVLANGLEEVLEQWKPTILSVEQLYASAAYPNTAVLMAHARGCYLLAAARRGIPVLSYAATQVKKAITGHGRASKEQMQFSIMRELNLASLPEPHDVADALAVALCHAYTTQAIRRTTANSTFTGVNMRKLLENDSL